MKKWLAITTASLAITAAGCSTAAMAQQDSANLDQDRYNNVFVQSRPGDSNAVILRDVEVEADGDEIIISGPNIRVLADGRVAISGGSAELMTWIVDHDMVFSDAHHAMRLAEIESDLASELGQLEDMHVIVDDLHMEGFEEAMAELERELGEIENRRVVIVNGERRELTDEERAEIHEEFEETREDIRESMQDIRREQAESQAERQEALRVMRIELATAREDMREAERETRQVILHTARNAQDRERLIEALRDGNATRIRFESIDGEERVWVDGTEVDGEARLRWLERLDTDQLEGGNRSRRIIIETTGDEE
ncbi:hypothetical protein [Hyphobacterium sp.]|uniref:hypothetical protein n=1 Tax=Hyphobacterium sp. TaxID=2004662 RepID=UPI003B526813